MAALASDAPASAPSSPSSAGGRKAARQIDKTLDSALPILADNSEHWKPRLGALHELQDMVESCRSTDMINGVTKGHIHAMRLPLQRQLSDLRSTIVRETQAAVDDCRDPPWEVQGAAGICDAQLD